MKKVFKILGIVLAVILSVFILLAGFILIKGPSDPIILTAEEAAEEERQQTILYSTVDLSGFDTVTLTGDKVTSDLFKDYKITMINLWTTDCSPCIEEMPDIAKLYDSKPEGSNIISICIDTVDDEKAVKFATKVMKDAGANFMTLIPDEVLQNTLTNQTRVYPTTIFVDSNGKVVGSPHFGANNEEAYRKSILDRIAIVDEVQSKQ